MTPDPLPPVVSSLLTSFAEHATEGILVFDSQGTSVFRNLAAGQILSSCPDALPCLLSLAGTKSQGGGLERFDFSFPAGKSSREVEVTARSLDIEGARFTCLVVRDVTDSRAREREERKVRDRLERAKQDWEQTFDTIRDAILILDEKDCVSRVNRAAAARLGRDFPEIIGCPVETLIGRRGAESVKTTSGGTRIDPVAIPELQGIFEISAYDRGAEGPRGKVLVLADVTEQVRLREQLLHSEKLSALGELVSGIAHELNNPLTAVLGYAQILALKDNGRFDVELSHLKHESLRASRIVRNLLTFARRSESARQPEDLNEVVRRTISLREYDLRVRNIQIDLDLADGLPRTMMDRAQLQQVVLSLLNNAEYAIHSLRDRGRIRIRTFLMGETLRMEFEDDGPGIPVGDRARIFHPFFSTKPVGKGTGLGLPICFGILKDHQGDIRLDPDYDSGARFLIDLPVVRWIPEGGTRQGDPERSFGKPLRPAGTPCSVLLVDDEASIRMLGTEFLTSLGHRVEVAANGVEARKLLAVGEFDVVLCDLRMPELDGERLYRMAVEESPRYRHRFVFMTGDTSSFDAKDGEGLVVAKPFDFDELDRIVRTVAGAE